LGDKDAHRNQIFQLYRGVPTLNLNIDPSWISSSLLFVIGALLIASTVLVLLLIEGNQARLQIKTTLEASVTRHKAILQEHRDELEAVEQQHLEKLAATERDHHYEMETLRGILSIVDQDRDEALRAASRAQEQCRLMQNKIDQLNVMMESWATGTDETAVAVRHALRAERTIAVS
jgi:hypothetical protein